MKTRVIFLCIVILIGFMILSGCTQNISTSTAASSQGNTQKTQTLLSITPGIYAPVGCHKATSGNFKGCYSCPTLALQPDGTWVMAGYTSLAKVTKWSVEGNTLTLARTESGWGNGGADITIFIKYNIGTNEIIPTDDSLHEDKNLVPLVEDEQIYENIKGAIC